MRKIILHFVLLSSISMVSSACEDETGTSSTTNSSNSDDDDDTGGIGAVCQSSDDCPAGSFCVAMPCDTDPPPEPGETCPDFRCGFMCAGGADLLCIDDDACCGEAASCGADRLCSS